jgi:hypothetical protein
MFSSTINRADRSVPSAAAPSAALNPARAIEVRGELVAEAVRRVVAALRSDANLSDETALVAVVRRTLDEVATDARHERDSHAGRGGVVFSAACDRGASDSSERARLVAPVIGRLRQDAAARERDRRVAEANAAWRQSRCAQQAARLRELAVELNQAADEREQCREVSMALGRIEAAIGCVRKQP